MKKTITKTQYNKLLNIKEVINNKGIKLIRSNTRFYIGLGVMTFSLLTPFTNWFLIPLALSISGLSFFDIKNIHLPEIKRKAKNKLNAVLYAVKKRGWA